MPRLTKWLKRSALVLLVLLVGFGAIAWATERWILPAYLHGRLLGAAGEYWSGPVHIGEVRLRWFSSVHIRDIRLEDESGRVWLETDTVTVRLDRWLTLSPSVSEVDIDRLAVHMRDSPPLRPSPAGEVDVSEATLPERIRVRSLLLRGSYGDGTIEAGPLEVRMNRNVGGYRLLARRNTADSDELTLSGAIGVNGRFAADLRLSRVISPANVRLAQALFADEKHRPVRNARARLDADLKLSGPLTRPADWEIYLTGLIKQGALTLYGLDVDELTAALNLAEGQLRVTELSCNAAGGRAKGDALVDLGNGPPSYEASLAVGGLDLSLLGESIGLEELQGGTISGDFTAAGDSQTPARIRGRGDVETVLAAGPIQSAGGEFDFDLSWKADRATNPQGRAELTGWRVSAGRKLTDDLDVSLAVNGREIEFQSVTAGMFGGSMEASGVMSLGSGPAEAPSFDVALSLESVSTSDIAKVFDAADLPAGKLNLRAGIRRKAGLDSPIRADGSADFEIDSLPDTLLTGNYDLQSNYPGEGDLRLDGSLSDWKMLREGDELATLTRADIQARDGAVAVSDAVLATAGGEVQADGRISRDENGLPVQHWRLSCRDFNISAAASGDDSGVPAVRLTADGSVTVVGDQHASAKLQGRADTELHDPEMRLESDISADVSLDDPLADDPLERLTADVKLRDAHLREGRQQPVAKLEGFARKKPDEPFELHLTGRFAEADVIADLRTTDPRGREYTGKVLARNVDISKLPAWLVGDRHLPTTAIDGSFTLGGERLDTLTVRGDGTANVTLDNDEQYHADGDYELDLRLGKPLADGVFGKARLSNWSVSNANGPVAGDLRGGVRLFGRSMDDGAVRGGFLGGKALGVLRVDFPADEEVSARGRFSVDDLELARIARAMDKADADVAGELDATYVFTSRRLRPAAVRGRGTLIVRGSRMRGVPVMQALAQALGARPEAVEDTDVDLAFDNHGQTVTVTGGRLSTPLMALSPLPGGTVNLGTGELDLHVVAALLEDIDELVNVPLLELLIPFTRQASQLHVTGTWHSRGDIRVSKEPLKDVGEATLQFFKDAVKTGGDLGTVVTHPVREVMP